MDWTERASTATAGIQKSQICTGISASTITGANMTKRNTTGVGYDGKSNAFARKGEATLAVHHDPNVARQDDHGVKGNLARDGAPKRMHPVSIHNGMTRNQQAGVNVGGMGHGTAVISGSEVIGTSAAAVPPVPAHRSGFNSPEASAVSTPPITHAYGKGIPRVRNAAPVAWNNKSVSGPIAKSLTDATPHDIRGQMLLDEAKR
jgi:hypothetical protein